jgi:uncharacterized caspase-like protein
MLHAVFVGIDRYQDEAIRGLSYARADAEAFKELIEEHIHPAERRVRLLTNEQATKRDILVTIGEELARMATLPEDVVLLYFACHGSPEAESTVDSASRYVIVHDTEYDNIFATAIDMERDLVRLFERIRAPKLVLLFMDACFSGRAGGRTFEGPHLSRARAEFRQTDPISLKNLDLGEGRLMISACDDNQVAREDSRLRHGVFTYYLMEALRQVDSNSNMNTISLNALYDNVARKVSDYTDGRQTPIINGRARLAQLPLFG